MSSQQIKKSKLGLAKVELMNNSEFDTKSKENSFHRRKTSFDGNASITKRPNLETSNNLSRSFS